MHTPRGLHAPSAYSLSHPAGLHAPSAYSLSHPAGLHAPSAYSQSHPTGLHAPSAEVSHTLQRLHDPSEYSQSHPTGLHTPSAEVSHTLQDCALLQHTASHTPATGLKAPSSYSQSQSFKRTTWRDWYTRFLRNFMFL